MRETTAPLNSYVVWIDHDHAKAFSLAPTETGERRHPTSVRAHLIDHHTHALDNLDREKRTHKMFQEAALLLNDANDILIVGPGLAKHLFNSFLAEHSPKIFRKIAGCETMDHPTDPQIQAYGENFFLKRAAAPALS